MPKSQYFRQRKEEKEEEEKEEEEEKKVTYRVSLRELKIVF